MFKGIPLPNAAPSKASWQKLDIVRLKQQKNTNFFVPICRSKWRKLYITAIAVKYCGVLANTILLVNTRHNSPFKIELMSK